MREIVYDIRKLLDIVIADRNEAMTKAAIWQAKAISLQEELDKLPKPETPKGVG